MKIRIQANSVRFRLSKPEVEQLCKEGIVEEQTLFLQSQLTYSVQKNFQINTLSASFENNKITLAVPAHFLSEWAENEVVGLDAQMVVSGQISLHLLIEKDFKCLDNVTEDQSHNYENPNKIC
ncbi:DUF7009 family protein [Dyadobacter arcticus]|uniref:Uncharacterized protein n=1 Tax=Dyadobacter arcticus TaxID=1078754 RepID=A0ABX0UJY4_9BACT|nr:hypothetical protein [Dyadobacter arcticus]NIJ53246.1 hypothetical protein [Dyadobacter arcticus]